MLCYSNCQAFSRQEFSETNACTSGYGPIMLIFANDSKLYYISGTNSNSIENLFYGAQFDLTSLSIFSEYINSTGGKSHYCSGIEYRNSLQGYLRYQTFVGQEGRYINSFSNTKFDVDISFMNFVNDSIVSNNDGIYGGIFNVDNCIITLWKICFIDIVLDQHGHFINGKMYKLVLMDCLISKVYENILLSEYVELINITFYDEDNDVKETNKLVLLNFGSCAGDLTPPPAPTLPFKSSFRFSCSNAFTHSNVFSKTNDFSESKIYTKLDIFLNSHEFSDSNYFSKSNQFLESNEFTRSNSFGPTPRQTLPIKLTYSMTMLESYINIKTVVFSNSYYFSITKYECNNEIGEKTFCETYEIYQNKFPYIIYSLSLTFVQTYFEHELKMSKHLFNEEQIIGIVCGTFAVFFSILGIIIIIIQKKLSNKIDSDLISDSDFTSENLMNNENNNEEKQIHILEIQENIKNDIDDWL